MKRKLCILIAVVILPALVAAQEKVDLSVVNRIKTEAFQNSKVMDHMFYLTDVYGARIADSPEYLKAAEWAAKTLRGFGMDDARLEKWGTFGRSWSYTRFAAHLIEPAQTNLIGVPLAWSPGTNGPVTGEVFLAGQCGGTDIEKYKGQMKGKWVIINPVRGLALRTEADARRLTDADLAQLETAPDPGQPMFRMRMRQESRPGCPPAQARNMEEYRQMRQKLNQTLKEEGVLGVISTGYTGDDGTVFTSPAGSRDQKEPLPPVSLSLTAEHFNRIVRLLEKKIPVKIEVEIRAQVYEDHPDGVNVVGNLRGGAKKDEIVMLGGHLDSWQGGTGAVDNAVGVAVMMESVRILNALGLKMDRTVRIGLWDAEEEGLLGSRGYVKEHFADPADMKLKPEHAKLSAYFNVDNGSGKIRGIYLQGNDMLRPVFETWLAPFKDVGATTVTIRDTGGTDHQSFDAVGLPGFQFIQDPLDYSTRRHHSNMDVYDAVQKGDLMQMSAIVATFAYNAATRPEMLARKPLPKPRGEGRGGMY